MANAKLNSKAISNGGVFSMKVCEIEVFRLMRAGMTTTQIADELGLDDEQFAKVRRNLHRKGKDWLNEEIDM